MIWPLPVSWVSSLTIPCFLLGSAVPTIRGSSSQLPPCAFSHMLLPLRWRPLIASRSLNTLQYSAQQSALKGALGCSPPGPLPALSCRRLSQKGHGWSDSPPQRWALDFWMPRVAFSRYSNIYWSNLLLTLGAWFTVMTISSSPPSNFSSFQRCLLFNVQSYFSLQNLTVLKTKPESKNPALTFLYLQEKRSLFPP